MLLRNLNKIDKFVVWRQRIETKCTKTADRFAFKLTKMRSYNSYKDPHEHLPKELLLFQPHWCEIFIWLMLKPYLPSVQCRICSRAHELHLLAGSVADGRLGAAFVSTGMDNWKHALDKFKSYEQTHFRSFSELHSQNSTPKQRRLALSLVDRLLMNRRLNRKFCRCVVPCSSKIGVACGTVTEQ